VDNIFSEKQQRLLTESLYTSWPGPGDNRPFVALANVGLFYALQQPALVPDVLVSLDVELPDDIWPKQNRSYFIWLFGKPPEVVIEIVSNQQGRETDFKLAKYAQLGIAYYIIFDPLRQLSDTVLRVYTLKDMAYVELAEPWLPGLQLGLTLWQGRYEDKEDAWLRWRDAQGNLIPTGAERAEQERQRAEREYERAERLAAQLKALGVEPEA
jgi:Uma2 family endonuclease